jgi:hypothetical protein
MWREEMVSKARRPLLHLVTIPFQHDFLLGWALRFGSDGSQFWLGPIPQAICREIENCAPEYFEVILDNPI